jgi:hypothetical protein
MNQGSKKENLNQLVMVASSKWNKKGRSKEPAFEK